MKWQKVLIVAALFLSLVSFATSTSSQAVLATLHGQVLDTSGGTVPRVQLTAVNKATGFSRTTQTSDNGEFDLPALPVGEYAVSAEIAGFKRQVQEIALQVGQVATLNFNLEVGAVTESTVVTATAELAEPTRTQVSDVITPQQIENLPVNGRQFIDFALLSPGVQVGNTTSGSTDVIVEPVTKLSFSGQNIHYNFIAVDGADDVSTASGIQRGTPPHDSVREFRVINSDYTTEFGRAVGGIVNIITRSGTNDVHGSVYEYFRNSAMDAKSILSAPGFHVLRQNQFGVAIGGPIRKDKIFYFANYEGQRHADSPTYSSAILNNIAAINSVKTTVFHLPTENLAVLSTANFDNGFLRADITLNQKNYLYVRYVLNDDRLTNQSPINSGFDLPSSFKNNYILDQSVAAGLTTTLSSTWINELRVQYANRTFDYPAVTAQPHLEVSNTFAVGVNRGSPDGYREKRFELVENATHIVSNHTISFGGNFDFVSTYESFPLNYPFRADFPSLRAFLGTTPVAGCTAPCPVPFVIFFERFNKASNFQEPTLAGGTAVYQSGGIPLPVHNQASATLHHTYEGFYIQDKWRATQRLTLNGGVRWEFETWPANVLNTQFRNFDPRVGLAYSIGTSRNFVFRAGFGLFHGTFNSPLLMCQAPSCGGQAPFPGRPSENGLNANAGLFSYAGKTQAATNAALIALLQNATYPDAAPVPPGVACLPVPPLPFPPATLADTRCGSQQLVVFTRFDQSSKTPYGIQTSASLEFQPFKDMALTITGMHVRGVHLGSFFNVNQADPTGTVLVHNSHGMTGCKNVYYANFAALAPGGNANCIPYPGIPGVTLRPGFRNPAYSVFFEATSQWDSQYDGLLVNLKKRLAHNFAYEISYTYSHSIDNGPNSSLVMMAQDSQNLRAERASSADDLRNRFVASATLSSPAKWHPAIRNFTFSTIVTLQSPQYFTKFAGSDVNGDSFGTNDRVGSEPRNTFKSDPLRSLDIRIARSFKLGESRQLQLMAEAFNVANSVNVRYFNSNYGATDFCPAAPTAPGCAGVSQFFIEGSPNPLYGTPSAVNNPRQIQLVARFTF